MKSILLLLVSLLSVIECVRVDNTPTCIACKKTANFVDQLSHSNDRGLIQSLAKLCSQYSHLPGKQSEIWCETAIGNLFRHINSTLNKNGVCYDIKACNDDLDNGIREFSTVSISNSDCEFCVFAMTELKNLVTGQPTELEIKAYFEDACHYMQSFENECLNLVNENLDALFKFINESFVPKDLCRSVRMCATKTGGQYEVTNLPSASELVNILPVNMNLSEDTRVELPKRVDPNCMICKKIVKIIQRQLSDNATDQQIINVLEEVCDLFPTKDQDNCKSVVVGYAKKLIEILTQDIDSDTACVLAGLCTANSLVNQVIEPMPEVNKKSFCVECELIAHFVQNELYNYNNELQIEEFVQNHLCNKMSFIIDTNNCRAFVQQYGPIIMQTLAQEVFDPATFCFKEVKLCSNNYIKNTLFIHDTLDSLQDVKCKMCQSHLKNLKSMPSYSDMNITELESKMCTNLPKPHSAECSLMLKTFLSYFVDMLDRVDDHQEICRMIDLCMVPGKVQLVGGHKCTYGPSYWCSSHVHATACKVSQWCKDNHWNQHGL